MDGVGPKINVCFGTPIEGVRRVDHVGYAASFSYKEGVPAKEMHVMKDATISLVWDGDVHVSADQGEYAIEVRRICMIRSDARHIEYIFY